MQYIFTGDIEYAGLTLVDDAEETERRISWLWSKAEFLQLTGILVADNVESFNIDPERNIYALKYQGVNEAEVFTDPLQAPQWMQDIWAARATIRMHLKAAVLTQRDLGIYEYYYDEQLDQIIQEDHPTRTHTEALNNMAKTLLPYRFITELVDILLAKGVITEGDLPSYYVNNINVYKSFLADIDWSQV